MCSRATPAASLAVTVHVREHVPVLADSPALDELRIEPSAESRAVALELIVSGHLDNGTAGSERFAGANRRPPPFPARVVALGQRGRTATVVVRQQLVL